MDKTAYNLAKQALEALNQLNIECGDCFPSIDEMVDELNEFITNCDSPEDDMEQGRR